MANSSQLQELFNKYLLRQLSAAELQELGILLQQTDSEEELTPQMTALWNKIKEQNINYPFDWDAMYEGITKQAPIISIHKRTIFRWAAAASIIIVVGLAYVIARREATKQSIPVAITHDVSAPQSTKAMITLADGRKISIDSLTTIDQSNVTITKSADGKIVYETTDHGPQTTVSYNTLTNPRGSKVIDMTLADGSHVWLNAGSSVTYPVAFVGNERKVTITGEAYFEVAHDATKPFYVNKGDVNVQVLGTHFNVNAYDDEDAIRVTLLEGSVQISALSAKNSAVKITPGQQAQVTNNKIAINNPDLEQVMAWKNGKFYFHSADLSYILRQASRWYDVDIEYQKRTDKRFNGEIDRNTNISNLLKALQLSGDVQFEVKGKTIIVK